MNSELRTIYLNLMWASEHDDWAAVDRAAHRLAVAIMEIEGK